jgi:hypothetical protein
MNIVFMASELATANSHSVKSLASKYSKDDDLGSGLEPATRGGSDVVAGSEKKRNKFKFFPADDSSSSNNSSRSVHQLKKKNACILLLSFLRIFSSHAQGM